MGQKLALLLITSGNDVIFSPCLCPPVSRVCTTLLRYRSNLVENRNAFQITAGVVSKGKCRKRRARTNHTIHAIRMDVSVDVVRNWDYHYACTDQTVRLFGQELVRECTNLSLVDCVSECVYSVQYQNGFVKNEIWLTTSRSCVFDSLKSLFAFRFCMVGDRPVDLVGHIQKYSLNSTPPCSSAGLESLFCSTNGTCDPYFARWRNVGRFKQTGHAAIREEVGSLDWQTFIFQKCVCNW